MSLIKSESRYSGFPGSYFARRRRSAKGYLVLNDVLNFIENDNDVTPDDDAKAMLFLASTIEMSTFAKFSTEALLATMASRYVHFLVLVPRIKVTINLSISWAITPGRSSTCNRNVVWPRSKDFAIASHEGTAAGCDSLHIYQYIFPGCSVRLSDPDHCSQHLSPVCAWIKGEARFRLPIDRWGLLVSVRISSCPL